MYRLSFDDGRCTLEPYVQLADDTTQPPKVDAQTQDVIDRSRTLHEAVSHPVWRSRFGHLLTASNRLVGRQRPDVAKTTVTDYLNAWSDHAIGLDRVHALRAALSLTRQFNLENHRTNVLDHTVAAARTALETAPNAAGIVLQLTQTLVDQRDPPDDIDALLELARSAYVNDPHNTDQVIEQQLTRATCDDTRHTLCMIACKPGSAPLLRTTISGVRTFSRPLLRSPIGPGTRTSDRQQPRACNSSPSRIWLCKVYRAVWCCTTSKSPAWCDRSSTRQPGPKR